LAQIAPTKPTIIGGSVIRTPLEFSQRVHPLVSLVSNNPAGTWRMTEYTPLESQPPTRARRTTTTAAAPTTLRRV